MKETNASGHSTISMKTLLAQIAERAAQYIEEIANRRVAPLPGDVTRLADFTALAVRHHA